METIPINDYESIIFKDGEECGFLYNKVTNGTVNVNCILSTNERKTLIDMIQKHQVISTHIDDLECPELTSYRILFGTKNTNTRVSLYKGIYLTSDETLTLKILGDQVDVFGMKFPFNDFSYLDLLDDGTVYICFLNGNKETVIEKTDDDELLIHYESNEKESIPL